MNAKINIQVGGRTIAALAHVLAEIRGTTGSTPWQPEGVAPALADALKHPSCTDLATLTRAGIRAALDPSIRTPAPIALDGRHWHEPTPTTTTTRPPRLPRCSSCEQEILTHAGETREQHVCKQRIDRHSPTRAAALATLRTAAADATAQHQRTAAEALERERKGQRA